MRLKALLCGWGFALLFIPLSFSLLAAQGAQEETVPMELFMAFVRGSGPGRGALQNVLVGEVTGEVSDLWPAFPGQRILGSLLYSEATISAISVPDGPAAVQDAWRERLLEKGWTPPPPRPQGVGFLPSPREVRELCKGDSLTADAAFSRISAEETMVMVTLRETSPFSVCRLPDEPQPSRGQSVIPPLLSPDGAQLRTYGGGGGGESWDSRARIRTDIGPLGLIQHYGDQLRTAGWLPVGKTSTYGIAVETYRIEDGEGVPWFGVLTAALPAEEADGLLYLRVTRVEDPRPW